MATINTYLYQLQDEDLQQFDQQSSRMLPEQEQERAGRFSHLPSRHLYLAGRFLLRNLLSARLGLAPVEIVLSFGDKGKPALAGALASACHFNLAHSGDWLVLSVSDRSELGVDIERVRALPDMDDLARRIMHVEEHRVYQQLPSGARTHYFFRIWAAKEAFVKWSGRGIGFGLDRVWIDPHTQTLLKPNSAAKMRYLAAPFDFTAALVWAAQAEPVQHRQVRVISVFSPNVSK